MFVEELFKVKSVLAMFIVFVSVAFAEKSMRIRLSFY